MMHEYIRETYRAGPAVLGRHVGQATTENEATDACVSDPTSDYGPPCAVKLFGDLVESVSGAESDLQRLVSTAPVGLDVSATYHTSVKVKQDLV